MLWKAALESNQQHAQKQLEQAKNIESQHSLDQVLISCPILPPLSTFIAIAPLPKYLLSGLALTLSVKIAASSKAFLSTLTYEYLTAYSERKMVKCNSLSN